MSEEIFERIWKSALEIEQDLIGLRRQIHRNPELAIQEFETARLVADNLRELDFEVTEGVGKTGVIGLLKGNKEGKTVALRADMDALPIEEESEHEYRSGNKNVMHACGHDVHTAALLGAAKLLAGEREFLNGSIKFIFQPSEESPLGGAWELIQEGVLENPTVDAVIGLHVDPSLPAGKIGCRAGPFYATGGGFRIEITGKGGHGALPHEAVDAIVISAELIQALQTIASSKIDPTEPFVLTIGTINGGQAANIIADKVFLTGTVRGFSEHIMKQAGEWIEKITKSITEAHGAAYQLEFRTGLKPLINDSKVTGIAQDAAEKLVGKENVVEVPRVLLGEDFALYSHIVPSSFLSLGASSAGKENFPLHHPKFDVNEKALAIGASLYACSAINFLNKWN